MPSNLPHRIEQAGAEDQRALLEEAFELIFPRPHSLMMRVQEPDATDEELKALSTAIVAWRVSEIKFTHMLNASAWESAAMMLMPEGWTHEHSGQWRTNKNNRWKWRHRLGSPERSHKGWPKRVAECFEAHTPALALLAAILKAKEAGDAD